MLQIRPGDFIAVSEDGSAVLFAILTKQILFGGHWSYVFHGTRNVTTVPTIQAVGTGFFVGKSECWSVRGVSRDC